MLQYIDKAALIAEIERKIKEIDEIGTYLSPKGVLTNLLCHLDTLEVKEVDLEKEFDKCCENYIFNDECELYTAKHFFELGLKLRT